MMWLVICVTFILLLVVWGSIEKKWSTVYVGQDPTNTYWNYVYIHPDDDASAPIQAALDFLAKTPWAGITRFAIGNYAFFNTAELPKSNLIRPTITEEE